VTAPDLYRYNRETGTRETIFTNPDCDSNLSSRRGVDARSLRSFKADAAGCIGLRVVDDAVDSWSPSREGPVLGFGIGPRREENLPIAVRQVSDSN
jgi:hypothetical protein